jgi:gluconolactonase
MNYGQEWLLRLQITAVALGLIALPALAQTGGIPGLIAPGDTPQLVQEGFTFLEGPVGTADGGLLFSDIRVNKTYRLDPAGKIAVVAENTNSSNGLALTKDGELLRAEGDGRRISKVNRDGRVGILTDSYRGMRLLSPNDVIADAKGGIYFTDPGPRPVVPGRPTYVFYLPAGAKEPVAVETSIARPNGLVLTMDGKMLVVDDTIGPNVFAFDIDASSGALKNKRVFGQLHDLPAGQESGADGMAIDRQDRVYVTTVSGVQVFDKQGRYLGTIKAGRQAANAAFSGPGKRVLYLTAREGLYRINTQTQGPERLGK